MWGERRWRWLLRVLFPSIIVIVFEIVHTLCRISLASVVEKYSLNPQKLQLNYKFHTESTLLKNVVDRFNQIFTNFVFLSRSRDLSSIMQNTITFSSSVMLFRVFFFCVTLTRPWKSRHACDGVPLSGVTKTKRFKGMDTSFRGNLVFKFTIKLSYYRLPFILTNQ